MTVFHLAPIVGEGLQNAPGLLTVLVEPGCAWGASLTLRDFMGGCFGSQLQGGGFCLWTLIPSTGLCGPSLSSGLILNPYLSKSSRDDGVPQLPETI